MKTIKNKKMPQYVLGAVNGLLEEIWQAVHSKYDNNLSWDGKNSKEDVVKLKTLVLKILNKAVIKCVKANQKGTK